YQLGLLSLLVAFCITPFMSAASPCLSSGTLCRAPQSCLSRFEYSTSLRVRHHLPHIRIKIETLQRSSILETLYDVLHPHLPVAETVVNLSGDLQHAAILRLFTVRRLKCQCSLDVRQGLRRVMVLLQISKCEVGLHRRVVGFHLYLLFQ